MGKLTLMLMLAGLIAFPLAAQEVERGEASTEELLAELHKLMRKASSEMRELERELARASLDAPRVDVVAERIRQVREAMREGRLDDLPEGLREHIAENPDEAAEATGRSVEEIRRVAVKEQELIELLRQNPELLKRLAESERVMERVLERQHAAERRLEETLRKQQESVEAAGRSVDEAIDLAHRLRAT
jgi:hypothetical protein